MAEQKKGEEANKKKLAPKETEEKLKECQKVREEYLAGWQRSRADFLNYKILKIMNGSKEFHKLGVNFKIFLEKRE
jgi:hypothetical protein